MCTSAQLTPINRRRSSTLDRIDRLTQAIDSALEEGNPDSNATLASLSSSLQSCYMSFGIFDSLTLARQKVRPSVSSENGTAVLSPTEVDLEGDLEDDDLDVSMLDLQDPDIHQEDEDDQMDFLSLI